MSESKYSPTVEQEKHKAEAEATEKSKVATEERRVLRQAQWEKNPDMFIHQDDVIFGAIETTHGIGILCGGHPRPKVEIAMTRMLYKSFMMFQHMDLQASLAQRENGLVDPEGNPIK